MKGFVLAAALGVLASGGCARSLDQRSAGDDRSVEELMRELGGEIPDHRLEAARALGRKGPEVVPRLIKALKDKDWKVRRGASDALAGLKADAKPAVPALIEALKDKEPWVRDGAATALGKIGPEAEAAARPLVEVLKDRELWLRESAIVALQAVTKDKELLLQGAINAVMFPDTGWSVRRHAVGVLHRHGKHHKPAIPALIYVLENPGEGMWQSIQRVAQLLAELGAGDKAVPILVRMLKSDHQGTRRKAAEALGKLGKEAAPAIAALRDLAQKSKDKRIRAAAKQALEQIEGKKPKK